MINKLMSYFDKYGYMLPYEIIKWKYVKKQFAKYSEQLRRKDPDYFFLRDKMTQGFYEESSLWTDCRRILSGERKILFYEDPDMKNLDPKYRWEENRIQHLYPLAVCISKTQDEDTSLYFIEEIRHYSNKKNTEDTNAMETAIASINLIVSCQIANLFIEEVDLLVARVLQRNLIYILENVENGLGFSNNHYFFDLLGVLWITSEINQNKTVKKLHAYAEKEMIRLLNQIISTDGSLYEGSTYYTRYIAEALSEYMVYHSDKQSLYISILQRMISFLNSISINGVIVGIGDNDSGRVLPIYRYFSYRSRDIQRINKLANILNLSIDEKTGISCHSDMGLLTVKTENYLVTLRSDPIVNKRKNRIIGGHEHNDQLSVQLSVGNEDIIVDPGTYLYISNNNYRINNMRTAVHSTLYYEELEQNPISNDWNYEERESAAIIERVEEHSIAASVRYADIYHYRTVSTGPCSIDIADKVISDHNGKLAFVLAPTLVIASNTGNEVKVESDTLEVIFHADVPINVETVFYSEEYGTRVKTIKLVTEARPNTRTSVIWKDKRKKQVC